MNVKSLIVEMPGQSALMHLARELTTNSRFSGIFGGASETSGVSVIMMLPNKENVKVAPSDFFDQPMNLVVTLAYSGDAPDRPICELLECIEEGLTSRFMPF